MQKRKKTKNGSLTARASAWLSLPESAFPDVPYLEVHGDSSAAVAGYESLLSYDSDRICLNMKESFCGVRNLCIEGKNLRLSALRKGCLSVSGEIDAVRFGHTAERGKEGR